jgi:CHAT domain-containing protein
LNGPKRFFVDRQRPLEEQLAADPKLSHAEALQKSMLVMINNAQRPDWADPKYWAPFVVVGEPAKPAN